MSIWALADLHLAKSTPSKNMAVFGPVWEGYMDKMENAWRSLVAPSDLVLLPGDISWAMRLDEALIDLEWIHNLPGTKLMIRGNHDYWWPSSKKLSIALPSSIHFIHNTAFHWHDIAIGGSRLWDSSEYNFSSYVHFQPNAISKEKPAEVIDHEAIFLRELERLRLSLQQMNPSARLKIAMTHYPFLPPCRASFLLEKFGINICVFGHLHNIRKDAKIFGEQNGIRYFLTSADYLDFKPIKLC